MVSSLIAIPLQISRPFQTLTRGENDVGWSTTAYVLYLGIDIISWKLTCQKSVSRSSTEAEYKALANASVELIWTKNLLHELGLTKNQTPTLFHDNTGSTYLCANPVYHSRIKHIALDYHFVREQVSAGKRRVLHISSQDQLADMLTKPLARAPFSSKSIQDRSIRRILHLAGEYKEYYQIIKNISSSLPNLSHIYLECI
ncbi:putative RNA-directed DNA polymerase [Helianthus annuus]|nr:putative RNA-directed DNA polymerase [Helianthus annuus]KAJ0846496.1 putative RNA-directed DNA polymerase [Helianthus annuus]